MSVAITVALPRSWKSRSSVIGRYRRPLAPYHLLAVALSGSSRGTGSVGSSLSVDDGAGALSAGAGVLLHPPKTAASPNISNASNAVRPARVRFLEVFMSG